MAEFTRPTGFVSNQPPPPAPPLPPSSRSGVLQRIIAPLAFTKAPDTHSTKPAQSISLSPRSSDVSPYYRGASQPQTRTHRAGVDIAALDVNQQRTHAILAGREILKTVKVTNGTISDELNLRSTVLSSTAKQSSRPEDVTNRRQFLPAKDVRWSHGQYAHIIATAAHNGRISLYDVSTLDHSRMELAWLYPHTSQVNKLDFDPHRGYMLLSGSQDKTCKIWDIRTPTKPSAYNQYNIRAPVRDVRWSPVDAFEFALCTESGVIQKWDVRFPAQAQLSINAHEKACYTIGWHPDGKHLVSGGLDKHLRVWNFKSDNRRQKPVFQLRTPQGVMNLAWRPPCWTEEFAQMGRWQSTQIATGYTDDDPRIHIWDLRRPLLPFREIDAQDKRPTDMLWATKDLLWTVGSAGMFTQTDIAHVPQVQEQLSPCAMDWHPDGSFVTFAEDRDAESRLLFNDPTANFLNIPPKRLSGDDGLSSHSVTDDEDTEIVMSNVSKRSTRTTSALSTKSLGSTPPTTENFRQVLPLDNAVADKNGFFLNQQVGSTCVIDGVSASQVTLSFLTNNFAKPATEAERSRNPETLLDRLEAAFQNNADVCDAVAMYRLAQSWRILKAVIVPELKDWANQNRHERMEYAQKRLTKRNESRKSVNNKNSAPFAKVSSKLAEAKSPMRSEKTISNLFRGVIETERTISGKDTNSNMTTPLAKPLPDSPATSSRKDNSTWYTLSDIVEPIAPLPPSVINSHSTASMASKALRDGDDDLPDSPASSPEKPRRPLSGNRGHKRSTTDLTGRVLNSDNGLDTPSKMSQQDLEKLNELLKSPMPHRTQEERRAALKDYRAQTRPLFTLDAPTRTKSHDSEEQQGSADSFLMFSTSTDSSHKERFWGKSFDTSSASGKTRQDSEDWLKKTQISDESSPSGLANILPDVVSREAKRGSGVYGSEATDFALDDSPEFAFGGMDGIDKVKSSQQDPIFEPSKIASSGKDNTSSGKVSLPANTRYGPPPHETHSDGGHKSTAGEGDAIQDLGPSGFHHVNPYREKALHKRTSTSFDKELEILGAENRNDLASETYLDIDFRSVNLTMYEPKLPFSWSALPLVCQMVEFDQKEGIAAGLFSVHIIMLIHPFFFSHKRENSHDLGQLHPTTLAERLLSPQLRERTIENIFARHMEYLRKMQLFVAWAEIRKICAELGYHHLSKISTQPVGSALQQDQMIVTSQCMKCQTATAVGENICRSCKITRSPCPVCEQIDLDNSTLWCFCHKCGHTSHASCITAWFLQVPESQGQCPSTSCMCDCGPGLIRQQRYRRQHQTTEETDIMLSTNSRTGLSGLKKDPLKASHSPAVDRARSSLRGTTSVEGLQSADEVAGSEADSNMRRRSSWSRTAGGSRGFGRNGSVQTNRESTSGVATPIRSSTAADGTATPIAGSVTGHTPATSADSRRVRVITPREESTS